MATQSKSIHLALKKRIREQGKTYADAAHVLGLSEASVKRLISTAGLSINRLEALCSWLNTDIHEIVKASDEQQSLVTELTPIQEQELLKDHSLLLVAYLILNHSKEQEILDTFNFTEPQLTRHLIKLEKIGLIELSPYNHIRLLTARNFSWSAHGPVQKFFNNIILKEFLQTNFRNPGEKSHFVGGILSKNSIFKLHTKMQELIRLFDLLLGEDANIPANERYPVSLFVGFRPWEYSEFAKLRRDKGLNRFAEL